MKKRWPGEFAEYASTGLFGSRLIALLVNDPDAIEPGSIVFRDSP